MRFTVVFPALAALTSCTLDDPTLGKPCNDGDGGCGVDFYCETAWFTQPDAAAPANGFDGVCVPGQRVVPALPPRQPVFRSALVVALAGGATVHGAFVADGEVAGIDVVFTPTLAPVPVASDAGPLLGALTVNDEQGRWSFAPLAAGGVGRTFVVGEVRSETGTTPLTVPVVVVVEAAGDGVAEWVGSVDDRTSWESNWRGGPPSVDARRPALLADTSRNVPRVDAPLSTPGLLAVAGTTLRFEADIDVVGGRAILGGAAAPRVAGLLRLSPGLVDDEPSKLAGDIGAPLEVSTPTCLLAPSAAGDVTVTPAGVIHAAGASLVVASFDGALILEQLTDTPGPCSAATAKPGVLLSAGPVRLSATSRLGHGTVIASGDVVVDSDASAAALVLEGQGDEQV
ncbi:MAG: hypothetical protein FJ137_22985, partial [Deltaproteobacteria bacterium]|nr:hypothetical protein [Deltaproteobacteria bacterium]